jgi:hypothetical protein
VVQWSEFLATDSEVLGSISGASRFVFTLFGEIDSVTDRLMTRARILMTCHLFFFVSKRCF